MTKVTVVQQVYHSRKYIPQVYGAIFAQTFKDFDVVAQIVADDGGAREYLQQHYPQVKILDPGYNIGFARGHNEVFASVDSEFFLLVNPDLILTPTFLEEMLKVFIDPKVGSASGKILRYDFAANKPLDLIDTTGVMVERSGAGRDRGQHETDRGQYDAQTEILGPSGAAAMYRKSALESVKYQRPDGRYEYFDQDFHSYWEDVDLAWRMSNAGFTSRFAPQAVAYHGRAAASSPGGYRRVFAFIKHHRAIPQRIRELNYKNHIFMFIKNSPHWYWQFFARELFYQIYVLFFETSTLKVLPEFFRQLPLMRQKRKFIKSKRIMPISELERLLS